MSLAAMRECPLTQTRTANTLLLGLILLANAVAAPGGTLERIAPAFPPPIAGTPTPSAGRDAAADSLGLSVALNQEQGSSSVSGGGDATFEGCAADCAIVPFSGTTCVTDCPTKTCKGPGVQCCLKEWSLSTWEACIKGCHTRLDWSDPCPAP